MSEPTAAANTQEPTLHIDVYEAWWIRVSLIVMVVFGLAIGISSFAYGFQVPGVGGRIDPTKLDAPGSPFAQPGIRELAPGKYEAYVVAQVWAFNPNPITVPAGSEVTFFVTSRDIQHGFKVMDTNINMMVLPGQISTLKTRFDTPGTHNLICHEYCGVNHHIMFGQIVVEPAPESASQ